MPDTDDFLEWCLRRIVKFEEVADGRYVPISCAVVTRDDAEILLVGNDYQTGQPLFWNLPGGAVDPGEDLRHAVIRELYEESGLEVLQVGRLAWVMQIYRELEHPSFLVFAFEVVDWQGEITLEHEEEGGRVRRAEFVPYTGACKRVIATIAVPLGDWLAESRNTPRIYSVRDTEDILTESQIDKWENKMRKSISIILVLIFATACATAQPAATTSPLPTTALPNITNTPAASVNTPSPEIVQSSTPIASATRPQPTATATPLPPTATSTPTDTLEPTGDGVHWTKHPNNPVLDVGLDGAWDDTLVGEPRVLRTADGFYMIYAGFDGTQEGGKFSPFYGYGLGAATSGDGISWEKRGDAPMLSLSGQEFGMLWHGGVFEQGQYITYYSLGSTRGGRTGTRIYRATSPDGQTWTPDSTPIIDLGAAGTYDDYDVYAPCILIENGEYKMWYTALSETAGTSIAYATSTDGVTWAKYAGNPVLAQKGAYYPAVLKVADVYMMWYSLPNPDDDKHAAIFLATSPDGISWTPHPENPVLLRGQEGDWDSKSVLEPSVYFDGRVFHMWFTGSSGPFQEKIGYATSP
jgi:ADP-ribose pyrophosphatase YjhB (NUDIX family)/predicted GH43/DUF377 family glycosyl hydrolase